MVNHGPNVWSAFHVVGAIFQAAYLNANPKNKLEGLQTISVGPGDGVAVEFIVDEPGEYVAVRGVLCKGPIHRSRRHPRDSAKGCGVQ